MMRALGLLIIASTAFGQPQLRFEEDLGSFVAHGGAGFSLRLEPDAVMVNSTRLEFAGATPSRIQGELPLPGRSHYLIGSDRDKWRSNVSSYARVRYENLYPGVDAIFYGAGTRVEFDFLVAPGADPDAIRLSVAGGRIDSKGDLVCGALHVRKPVIYQEGRVIRGGYRRQGRDIGFEIAAYDKTRPLVIDPVLAYSTYLGASGGGSGEAIAVDAAGAIYIAGTVNSNYFPTVNARQSVFAGSNDVFVTKLDPTGSTLIYSTYIGAIADDRATAIAVGPDGSAYVTGFTASHDFPTVNALQETHAGGGRVNGGDAFVFRLSPDGSSLIYSTFLGGSADDFGRGIAVDSSGAAYVAGITLSTDFPVANALQPEYGGGARDAFVAKLSPDGSQLLYSTYLGGTGTDEANGIAVDTAGNAYVTGETTNVSFPTVNAVQATYAGGARDVFVSKIDPEGSKLVYSTLIGGSADDFGRSIAVGRDGAAVVTGYTTSTNLRRVNAMQTTLGAPRDAFVSKLNPEGTALIYSTYLGGTGTDEGFAVAVDEDGYAYVAGFTQSPDFPIYNPTESKINLGACVKTPCANDVFVAKIQPSGAAIVYSTFLGGTAADVARAITVDGAGGMWVTGTTTSTNFPTANPLQSTNNGGGPAVAFVSKLGDP
jgi:hypothetical protein